MRRACVTALALVCAGAVVVACAPANEYVVRGTERSVGVDGTIEITRSEADVNVVTVNVVNLPPPERHARDLRAFVVWITPKGGEPIRAGSLDYSPVSRRGKLRVTTPNDEIHVKITAEPSPRVAGPGEFVVVTRDVTLKTGETELLSDAR